MAMTIKVYEVNRAGTTVRVLRPETEVVPLKTVDRRAAFPDCECPRHRPAGSEAAYRTYVSHTSLCATCRAGAPCPTAARLGQAWRQIR
ncbi:hypothetical protein [Streptomyces sp. NPDC059814]|uniref:hypothetical protein n=1 Tax=unclassified Streptomyces TaxID=2593676 RepID=UPI00364CE453